MSLKLDGFKEQLFHRTSLLRVVDSEVCLRINIHSVDKDRTALIHRDEGGQSSLLHKEKTNEDLESLLARLKLLADERCDCAPPTRGRKSGALNWSWVLIGSELTEFGAEESWHATWQGKQPAKLRNVELHVNWFRGNHNQIPSFASIEILRKNPRDYTELKYIELPLGTVATSEENQAFIEHISEDFLLTPMDHLSMLLIAR